MVVGAAIRCHGTHEIVGQKAVAAVVPHAVTGIRGRELGGKRSLRMVNRILPQGCQVNILRAVTIETVRPHRSVRVLPNGAMASKNTTQLSLAADIAHLIDAAIYSHGCPYFPA